MSLHLLITYNLLYMEQMCLKKIPDTSICTCIGTRSQPFSSCLILKWCNGRLQYILMQYYDFIKVNLLTMRQPYLF